MPHHRRVLAAFAFAMLSASPVAAEDLSNDPLHACDRAAARAEADWHLPNGLLSAIGIVESGRSGLGTAWPVPWPWSINADGYGYVMPGKAEAIAAVRALRGVGRKVIDVGCFQIDLFYHPEAFATLAAAFDPEANAQAAARILVLSRLNGNSWDMAIALYHSVSPMLGARYLQKVQTAWPLARSRGSQEHAVYAVMLSPAARHIRVINAVEPQAPPSGNLPRVLSPQTVSTSLQWTALPQASLPVVLTWPVAAVSRPDMKRLRY